MLLRHRGIDQKWMDAGVPAIRSSWVLLPYDDRHFLVDGQVRNFTAHGAVIDWSCKCNHTDLGVARYRLQRILIEFLGRGQYENAVALQRLAAIGPLSVAARPPDIIGKFFAYGDRKDVLAREGGSLWLGNAG